MQTFTDWLHHYNNLDVDLWKKSKTFNSERGVDWIGLSRV